MCSHDASSKGIPIRSVSRAIQVLQIINRLGNPTMTEIREESKLPYATVFRLTSTLLYEGLIECEPVRKRYRPTELVWSLGMGFQQEDQLAAIARSELAGLTAEHYWPVALSVRIGNQMVVKDSTHAQTTQTFMNYYPGFSLPLLSCGAGRAYIAFCPDDEREIILSAAEASKDEETIWNLQILRDEEYLNRIRQQGFATHARLQHNQTPGKTSSIAVPVIVGDRLRACMAIIYFDNSMNVDEASQRYSGPLIAASKRISEAVGAVMVASETG